MWVRSKFLAADQWKPLGILGIIHQHLGRYRVFVQVIEAFPTLKYLHREMEDVLSKVIVIWKIFVVCICSRYVYISSVHVCFQIYSNPPVQFSEFPYFPFLFWSCISLPRSRDLCQGSLMGVLCDGHCQPARVLVQNVLTCRQSHGLFGKRPWESQGVLVAVQDFMRTLFITLIPKMLAVLFLTVSCTFSAHFSLLRRKTLKENALICCQKYLL